MKLHILLCYIFRKKKEKKKVSAKKVNIVSKKIDTNQENMVAFSQQLFQDFLKWKVAIFSTF